MISALHSKERAFIKAFISCEIPMSKKNMVAQDFWILMSTEDTAWILPAELSFLAE